MPADLKSPKQSVDPDFAKNCEKVFEHMCAADALSIDSQYMLKALLQAEIIEKHDLYMLQVVIGEIAVAR